MGVGVPLAADIGGDSILGTDAGAGAMGTYPPTPCPCPGTEPELI
jgi:hypothetical protein